jgi:hypothetical protein
VKPIRTTPVSNAVVIIDITEIEAVIILPSFV